MTDGHIKPCPFCASHLPTLEEVDMDIWAVVCACGTTGPIENFSGGAKQDRAKAVDLWNRRPAA